MSSYDFIEIAFSLYSRYVRALQQFTFTIFILKHFLLFSVPSRPPINMTAFNTSSTSINVTWEPVPDDHVNGIVLGYRLFYKQADKAIDDFSNLTVNSTVFSIELESLEFYTKYELQLLAFTVVGDGNVSEPVYCMTDEDGKLLLH